MAVKAEKTTYSHFGAVIKLSNGTVDVMVTTDIGPRIIYYGFTGGANILAEMGPEDVVKTDLGDWHPWGGHRLWTSPEGMPRSYATDNEPVEAKMVGSDCVHVSQPADSATHMRKEMLVKLDEQGTQVTITHRITNEGLWAVEFAPWGLTIVNGGGTTIFPQEPFAPHGEVLLPARPLVLWNYTDMSDPRWTFGKKFVRLQSDPKLDYPQKIGAAIKAGWAAYLRENLLFIKRFPYIESAEYPDFGCNFETFTKGNFMEVETLGALANVEPGESVEYMEQWNLSKAEIELGTDESLEAQLMPIINAIS